MKKGIIIKRSDRSNSIEIHLIEQGDKTLIATITKDSFDDDHSYEFYKSFCGSYEREEEK